MRNKVEDIEQEVFRLQKANKDLKNENRKLKGEPREPNIKPPTQAQKAEENNLKGEKEKKNKNHFRISWATAPLLTRKASSNIFVGLLGTLWRRDIFNTTPPLK